MSTRSTIAVLQEDGTVKSTYCHWDGYPSWMGKILLEHYDTKTANQLLELGELSSLHPRIAPEKGEKHSYDKQAEGVTVAYHRDRGDRPIRTNVSPSLEEYTKRLPYDGQSFNYLLRDNVWFVYHYDEPEWIALTPKMCKEGVFAY